MTGLHVALGSAQPVSKGASYEIFTAILACLTLMTGSGLSYAAPARAAKAAAVNSWDDGSAEESRKAAGPSASANRDRYNARIHEAAGMRYDVSAYNRAFQLMSHDTPAAASQ